MSEQHNDVKVCHNSKITIKVWIKIEYFINFTTHKKILKISNWTFKVFRFFWKKNFINLGISYQFIGLPISYQFSIALTAGTVCTARACTKRLDEAQWPDNCLALLTTSVNSRDRDSRRTRKFALPMRSNSTQYTCLFYKFSTKIRHSGRKFNSPPTPTRLKSTIKSCWRRRCENIRAEKLVRKTKVLGFLK